jgi:hypothetical protein
MTRLQAITTNQQYQNIYIQRSLQNKSEFPRVGPCFRTAVGNTIVVFQTVIVVSSLQRMTYPRIVLRAL